MRVGKHHESSVGWTPQEKHDRDFKNSCDQREFYNITKVLLDVHAKKEHEARDIKNSCVQREFKNITKVQLNEHVKSEHEDWDIKISCDECEVKNVTKVQLSEHTTTKHESQGRMLINLLVNVQNMYVKFMFHHWDSETKKTYESLGLTFCRGVDSLQHSVTKFVRLSSSQTSVERGDWDSCLCKHCHMYPRTPQRMEVTVGPEKRNLKVIERVLDDLKVFQ